jgi:hypothetical protein
VTIETRNRDERLKVVEEEGLVYLLTETYGATIAKDLRPLHARRLVACWNACAGLSTEALEAGVLRELITHAGEADDSASGWERSFLTIVAKLLGET